ncbi:MAG: hypothetical protein AAFX06_15985 [Planctomycetota bacterium]
MNESACSEMVALIERHLDVESDLATTLDELNAAMKETLDKPGMQAPQLDELKTLEPVSQQLQQSTVKLATARKEILNRVKQATGKEHSSLRTVIDGLPKGEQDRLHARRIEVMDRTRQAQANLLHNQATCFYLFDFHRKYLTGVVQGDLDGQKYRADGQPNEFAPGNIIGKAC